MREVLFALLFLRDAKIMDSKTEQSDFVFDCYTLIP